MNKFFAPIVLILGFILAPSAAVASDGCTVVSSTSTSESRDVAGQQAGPTTYGPIQKRVTYRHGRRFVKHYRVVVRYAYTTSQHRIVTVSQCDDGTTLTSERPWSSGMIKRTETTEPV